MKFNKDKYTVLPLGNNRDMNRYKMGSNGLNCRTPDEDLGIIAHSKMNASQQHAMVAREAKSMMGYTKRNHKPGTGSDSFTLFRSGESTSRVPCSVLATALQEPCRSIGEFTEKQKHK